MNIDSIYDDINDQIWSIIDKKETWEDAVDQLNKKFLENAPRYGMTKEAFAAKFDVFHMSDLMN